MINIGIISKGKKIATKYECTKDVTYDEAARTIYELQKIIQDLISIEWQMDYSAEEKT